MVLGGDLNAGDIDSNTSNEHSQNKQINEQIANLILEQQTESTRNKKILNILSLTNQVFFKKFTAGRVDWTDLWL